MPSPMESATFFLWLHLPKNSKYSPSGSVGHSGDQQLRVTDYQFPPRFLRRQNSMMARMWSVSET